MEEERKQLLRQLVCLLWGQVYALKVWEALNSPETAKKWEAMKKWTWGPTKGWKDRTPWVEDERNPDKDGIWIASAKVAGYLIKFDTVDKNGNCFPKDCEIWYDGNRIK
jgi:hypothetical protein